MNNLGVIFFLMLTLPQAISGQKIINDTGEIPFEMVKNTIVIEVNILGAHRKFVVDTGGVWDINKKEIAFKF
ncbi:MAG: hypothetical protein AAGG59_06685 [Bacteroidota bacterium]